MSAWDATAAVTYLARRLFEARAYDGSVVALNEPELRTILRAAFELGVELQRENMARLTREVTK